MMALCAQDFKVIDVTKRISGFISSFNCHSSCYQIFHVLEQNSKVYLSY